MKKIHSYCVNCMEPIVDETRENLCKNCKKEKQYHAPHLLAAGTILQERYLIGTIIGQGGFGITYIGRDLKLDTKVAIKEYYPTGYASRNTSVSPTITISSSRQREFIEKGKKNFLNEARVLAKFDQEPGIVSVKDFFEANETAYIVMEYLEGENLYEYLKHHVMTEKEILNLFYPILISLQKIHEDGIIHRDISPDNIMILKNGRLKLMDFGAAKLADYTGQKSVSIILKSGYAPEEQYRPDGKLGPWTDIYALCATIYYCITKQKPADALSRFYKDDMKWPSELGFPLSKQTEKVLKRGLSIKQEERYPTIQQLKKQLYKKRKQLSEKQKKQKKLRLLAAMSLTLFFFISLSAVIGVKLSNPEKLFKKKFDPEKMYHITLLPQEETSVSEFNSDVAILEERLTSLAGNGNYIKNKREDMLEFYISKEAVSSDKDDIETIFRQYISYPIKLYLWSGLENILIERKDIESVKIEQGIVDGVNREDYSIKTDTYPYIEIKLTDSFLEKNKEQIDKWIKSENAIHFVQDITLNGLDYTFYQPPSEMSKDKKTWKIFVENLDYLSLTHFNYSNAPLSCAYKVWIDYENIVKWDIVEKEEAKNTENTTDSESSDIFGLKQCNAADFDETTVTLLYDYTRSASENILSEGDITNIKQALQMQLDAIGLPYALGTYKDGSSRCIAVKTLPDRMSSTVMQLLGSIVYWEFQTDLSYESVSSDFIKIKKEKTKSGEENYTLYVDSKNIYATWKPKINELLTLAKEAKKDTFVLSANVSQNHIPLLYTNINTNVTNDFIKFTNFAFSPEEKITKDTVWFLDFLNAIEKSGEIRADNIFFRIKNFTWRSKDGGPCEDDLPSLGFEKNEQAESLKHEIKTIYEDADIEFTKATCVNVYLNLPIDETLPKKALELTEKLYRSIDFENSMFQEIHFYFTNQEDTIPELANIIFLKDYNPFPQKGCISMQGSFYGERINKYQKNFKEEIKKRKFFQEQPGREDFWSF